ncbi:MAG TPA: YciI family protein [Gammaproteobacteria bacterium]
MRFMILLKANAETERGVLPSNELLTAMTQYNELLTEAGVLEAGEGLQPTAKGARVHFSANKCTETRGPFADADHDIAGFWIFKADSLDEAIKWVKRCPFPFEGSGEAEIEIRQIYEASDFGAAFTPELREAEERMREHIRLHGQSETKH